MACLVCGYESLGLGISTIDVLILFFYGFLKKRLPISFFPSLLWMWFLVIDHFRNCVQEFNIGFQYNSQKIYFLGQM